MKYKLKRDLPFAKAGAEVKIISVYSNEFPHSFYTLSIKGDLIKAWYRIEIPKDRFTEWIEEVKPREWYEIQGTIESDFWGYRFHSYKEAAEYMDKKSYNLKYYSIIKVREVLE